jgi:predicted TPR repeat methyltransferase
VSGADPYTRLAAVYDEIVVDPCHGQWAGFLHELWAADTGRVRTVVDVCCGTGLMAAGTTGRGI